MKKKMVELLSRFETIRAEINDLEKEIMNEKEGYAKQIEIDAETLSNAAYSRLSDLMEGDLGMSSPGIEAVNEAEILIKIQKYIAERSPFILLKISYDGNEEEKKKLEDK